MSTRVRALNKTIEVLTYQYILEAGETGNRPRLTPVAPEPCSTCAGKLTTELSISRPKLPSTIDTD